ncbi:ArsC family reductase [Photobacterium sp. WH77]|uniref:ArsC family reductase n=1 Tax=Photobacterium arenosum TaxID=2774143 RepID=A0ABR9BGX7_9GAMM|nr:MULTISPECIES: ArsC family reductase [Photobacterium]MBD8511801.1 ArsC family reductase [Photobacterium arenosum]MBV7261495.1 ArsC family reductase [Photobacterium sp. WH24]MCG2836875.1 ArsC family reductase [Photobacterium sp. WH77]MCG2844516.1 ArsC family reductase [Photobacterium sp. WH80]MDO6581725.1 ArsC family reductase [Photobacterium sp. 2_MG-2023]
MSTIAYGIKNCDTIKKMKKWLDEQGIEYRFHDYRADGLDRSLLEAFEAELGWEALLNKRGTTFRQLSDEQKNTLNRDSALTLMLEQPAMIKRPLLVHNQSYHLGFKPDQYQAIFA